KDFSPGFAAPNPPSQLTAMGGVLYFRGDGEFWRSDGTDAGTYIVKRINPTRQSFPTSMVSIGPTLFFNALGSSGDRELWQSDGTEVGTTLVKDIWPGTGESNPSSLSVFNGLVYFSANDGAHGVELWRSDGTDAGR